MSELEKMQSTRQSAESATKIPRGRPAFAETQRAEILRMLREAGVAGVSREVFIFERHFTQCGARVDELKRQGFVIVSEQREGERYICYVLKSEPLELRPLADTGDWYTRETGRERPKQTPEADLPLFASRHVERSAAQIFVATQESERIRPLSSTRVSDVDLTLSQTRQPRRSGAPHMASTKAPVR